MCVLLLVLEASVMLCLMTGSLFYEPGLLFSEDLLVSYRLHLGLSSVKCEIPGLFLHNNSIVYYCAMNRSPLSELFLFSVPVSPSYFSPMKASYSQTTTFHWCTELFYSLLKRTTPLFSLDNHTLRLLYHLRHIGSPTDYW